MAMKTAKKYNPDLILHGNLIRAILSLAIPVVINSFLQTMYNLTDTYWLGKIGTEQLAAINLVTPMQNIITNFGSGITVAGAVLIAQYIGAGEKEDARSMANHIFACAMGFAVVCATLCFLGTPAIINWLGADGGTAYYARVYLRVVIWDMPFLYMVNIFSAVHQAQGDTVRPMFLNLGGITLNLFLDPFFMIILDLGTAGAALATLLAKAIPAMVAFGLLCRQENDICLNRAYMRLQREKLGMILKIGLPTAIGGSTMQLGFLLMSKNVFVYGTEQGEWTDHATLQCHWFGNGHYRGAEYGSKAAGPCGEGISVFHVDIGCIFVHRWYDLIKRYDFHGNCRNLFQGCGSCGHGGRLFKCYGILVLYQWRIQYDLRFVPGNRPYGGDHGHRCDQIVGIPFPDTVVLRERPAYGRAQCLVFRGDQ